MGIDFNERLYILDGAMGTMLQRAGCAPGENTTHFALKHPEILLDIHKQYIDAGSDVLCAATFGVSRFKEKELGMPAQKALTEILGVADEAKQYGKSCGKDIKIALDVSNLGELLEPMGTLTFEEAYDEYKYIMKMGEAKGADIVIIETMTDLYDTKAALLAAKENISLPVIVSMTFEEDGRTFTGTGIEEMVLTMEGLGADAVGINCSLGPEEIFPMACKMKKLTKLPVFIKPNAGLPDPVTGEYDITCDRFAEKMKDYVDMGVSMIGGCCGTTPEYIRKIAKYRDLYTGAEVQSDEDDDVAVVPKICSGSKVVAVDHVTIIGERINPTGKKRLKQALLDEDYDYIMTQAIEQIDAGAEVLDVNVGVPSIDDVKILPNVVKKLQSVTNLPLQIDSSNPEAIEAALRVYNGKAIVNSVNGEEAVMKKILPVVKKYGAAVIGLTLDERGIPKTAEERFEIACRILKRAEEYGIPGEDVIIDCLTLTVSAQQKEVNETLRAVRMVKEKLGLRTALGVSNVSFGLPIRPVVNRTFLTMAMECGLDLPIINPNDEDMMASVYAFNVLKNADKNASAFIDRYGADDRVSFMSAVKNKPADKVESPVGHDIFYSIEKGMKADTVSAVNELLREKDEMAVVNENLIPALDNVGKGFEKGTIFLPQMLQAATAAQAGFEVIKARLAASDRESVSLGDVVIATVKGDIHDIGKNIVKVIMENYGYKMIDLGRDVPAEKIVDAVKAKGIKLVGLSALMTTTLKSMEETIRAVKAAAPDCKVMVGGAVLTADYAEKIGADYYCKDAMKSVEAAQEVFDVQI